MSSQSAHEIVARHRYVLLDFDGPICAVFGGVTDRAVALNLADELDLEVDRETTSDPFEVFRAAAAGGPDLAAAAHAAFTRLEVTAARSAPLTAGIVELLEQLEEDHQIAVVSNNSEAAVRAMLEAHGLAHHILAVAARTEADPSILKPSPYLVRLAMSALGASPDACVLVGDSLSDVDAARTAGTAVIAYANKPGKRAMFTALKPQAIVDDLHELYSAEPSRPQESPKL